MRKLVIVSYIFPPGNRSNAKRPFLMARYLVKQGWDVTVLTSYFLAEKNACTEMESFGIRVERLPSLSVFFAELISNHWALVKCFGCFFDGIIFPDLFAPWIKRVAKKLKKMDYDCGILHVLPYSSLFLDKYGILDSRWVIDYQESIYPFWEERAKSFPIRKRFLRARLKLELDALASVGSVWFTSNSNRLRYIKDGVVSKQKAKYVPLFYDPAMYSFRKEQNPDDIVTILYGGRFDRSWRSPETFFKSWSLFHARCPSAKGSIRLKLYGDMDNACDQMAEELGVAEYIDQQDTLPYQKFLEETTKADVLLYVDAREQKYFFPGKLVDYFGAAKPILAFTQPGSSVEKALIEVGMNQFVADMSSAEAGASALGKFWEIHKNGVGWGFLTEKYSIKVVCQKIDALLKDLCAAASKNGKYYDRKSK